MGDVYVDGQVEYECAECGAGSISDYQGWMSGRECVAKDETCSECGHHTVMMRMVS